MSEFETKPGLKKIIPWWLPAIFLLLTGVIIVMGSYYYKSERKRIFSEQEKSLSAIASLKISQIASWHKERLGDAKVFSLDKPLIISLEYFFSGKNKEIKTQLYYWMMSVRNEYDYSNVLIADTSLKVRLSVTPSDSILGDSIKMEMKASLKGRNIFMTDLHRSKEIPYIHIDILIPLFDSIKNKPLPVGIALLRIDPGKVLFPLIQSWPTPSKSSETLILRREGDSVLYLNELRHRKNTALNLKFPLSNVNLLATKAVNGFEGVTEGIDYRQIPVIGALSKIPGLPWYMVAKTDKEEILAPFKRYSIITVFVIILLIILNALVSGYWIWAQRAKMYRSQLKDEIALRESKEKLIESEELFRKLFENMLNGFAYCKMIFKDDRPYDFIYLKVNKAFGSLTGLINVEGRKVSDVIPGIQEADPELLERYGRVALTGKPEVFENWVESLKMWFLISVYSPQKEHFVAVFDVITDRKLSEAALRESEERFRSLYENATIGIYRTTPDGKILLANPALVRMLGFSSYEDLALRNLEEGGYEPDYPRAKFLEILEKEGKIIGLESAWHQRNGKTLYVRESASIIRDAEGNVLYYDGNVEDITYRKQVDEALRESEKRLREAQEMAHLGFWLWDIKTGNVEWSEEVFKIFCLNPETFTPKIDSILELSPWPEDHQRDKELIARAMETHTPGDYEQKFLRPDKSVGYYYSTFRGNYDDSGELISIVGTVLDITERKLAEDALRESEDKFKYVFDHSLIPKSITLLSGEINVNGAFCEMLGYQPEELKRINWADISHPDDIELTNDSLNLVLSGKKDSARFIKRYIHKNGTIVWADVGTSLRRDADNNPQYFLTSVNDITERKAAEEALRDSEERFSKSFRTSPISFMIANLEDGKIIEVNDAFTTISGFTREEALASTTLELKIWVNEQDRKHLIDSLRKGHAILHQETHLRSKEGKIAIVLLSAQVIKLANRNCIISSIEDITVRKRAEEALRESEERFHSMANSIPQLAWVARADGFIYWYNQRWYDYTGTKPEQMEGWGWQIVHDPEVLPQVMKNWTASIASGQTFEMSFPLRGADGQFRTFLTQVHPWKDSEGRVIQWFGTNTDVETLKRAEEIINKLNEELEQKVMQRTEQLEAANKELEAFSYSVSHDLRAPLRSVHGFTKILLEDYEASLDEEGKRICGIISSSATQMGELIDDLLSFSRIGRSTLNPSEIDMKKMVKNIFEGMTSPVERRRIKLKTGKLHKAFGDVALFGQVWTNLLSNAIKYSSKNDISEINIGSESDGKMITYFVKDNGVGFDMQYGHKLFGVFQRLHSEADFEGNGVGLAIVQRIVLKHAGKVWAEGEVGKGATFYFSLPIQDKRQK
jgi:PAS domain S-box-containing protein